MSNYILHLHYQIIKVLGLGRSVITYLAQDIDRIKSPLYVVKEIQLINNSESSLGLIQAIFEDQSLIAYRVGQPPQDLILLGAIFTLLLGTGIVKLLSITNDRSQLLIPTIATSKVIAPIVDFDPQWQIYTDNNLKIKYAKNWQKDDLFNVTTGEHVIFTSPNQNSVDKYQENISIRVEKLTNPRITLSNYTQVAIAEIKKYYLDAKIIESSSINLANKPAKLVVFTGKDEKALPIKNLEVWTIDRGNAYIITYKAAPDRYYQFLETAMTMINSLELK
ncbi:MAG: hypothetical protein LH474_09725 [Chamaesiphon sp.]|nr:hypothetical protein [Chamaesiphon sp.]